LIAFHQVDVLTAGREEEHHEHMPATSESTPIRWHGRASKRSIGEGTVELLLRRGRLGSPPA